MNSHLHPTKQTHTRFHNHPKPCAHTHPTATHIPSGRYTLTNTLPRAPTHRHTHMHARPSGSQRRERHSDMYGINLGFIKGVKANKYSWHRSNTELNCKTSAWWLTPVKLQIRTVEEIKLAKSLQRNHQEVREYRDYPCMCMCVYSRIRFTDPDPRREKDRQASHGQLLDWGRFASISQMVSKRDTECRVRGNDRKVTGTHLATFIEETDRRLCHEGGQRAWHTWQRPQSAASAV